MKIFVAGLPYDLYDDELMEIFEKFGNIISAKVAMDKETGKSKGFGFVEMQNDVEALDAIESLNDINLGKKPLVVKKAEENTNRPSGNTYRGGTGGNSNGNSSGGNNSNGNSSGNNNSGGFNRDRRY